MTGRPSSVPEVEQDLLLLPRATNSFTCIICSDGVIRETGDHLIGVPKS